MVTGDAGAATAAEPVRYLPWGTVTDRFWTTGDGGTGGAGGRSETGGDGRAGGDGGRVTGSPAEAGAASHAEADSPAGRAAGAEVLAAVMALAAAGDLGQASSRARRREEEVRRAFGDRHPELVDIGEVRGYLAHLAADHATAVRRYLDVLRLRAELHGPDHPDTELAVRRTYSLWRAVPAADALAVGPELLSTVVSLLGPASVAGLHIANRLPGLLRASAPLPPT
ncbi:hypothetical protein ACFWUQ_02490 [Streptomyces sp. NPDC058662]|uniref:hypothetical protein n=1 Tax=Streptomyces sp. NPDC058662 TaxID=3346583 RepID=UPI003665372F